MKVTFCLLHNDSDIVVKEANTLKEIFDYIRWYINEPSNWYIEEREDGQGVAVCNAKYLIENFKADTLPVCVSDIN